MQLIGQHRLDQRRLEHFLAVTETGSINRAAREIGISQAGLTRSIQTLEDTLGAKLFVRGPKGVQLTKSGETLHAYATVIRSMFGAAVRAVDGVRSGTQGTLRLGIAQDWFVRNSVPDVLAKLLDDPRQPRFRVHLGQNSWKMLDQMARGELDLVIGAPTAFDGTGDYIFREGLVDVQGVLVRNDNPLARASEITLDALDAAGWVLAEDETFYRRFLAGIYQSRQRLLPQPLVTSHTNDLIVDLLVRRDLVGVGTRLLAESRHPGRLTMLPYPPQIPRPIGVLHRRDIPLTDMAVQLIEDIVAALRAYPHQPSPQNAAVEGR
jgi:DNA-binding transcriptional LysR family regulator